MPPEPTAFNQAVLVHWLKETKVHILTFSTGEKEILLHTASPRYQGQPRQLASGTHKEQEPWQHPMVRPGARGPRQCPLPDGAHPAPGSRRGQTPPETSQCLPHAVLQQDSPTWGTNMVAAPTAALGHSTDSFKTSQGRSKSVVPGEENPH